MLEEKQLRRVWMSAAGFDLVFAIADEDMSRENDEKTAAVHFLRFEFSAPMITALKDGKSLAVGVDHEHYHAAIGGLAEPVRLSLVADLK